MGRPRIVIGANIGLISGYTNFYSIFTVHLLPVMLSNMFEARSILGIKVSGFEAESAVVEVQVDFLYFRHWFLHKKNKEQEADA